MARCDAKSRIDAGLATGRNCHAGLSLAAATSRAGDVMAKRKHSGRKLTPEQVAQLVADSLTVGTAAAAHAWKVSPRTVERYRAKVEAGGPLTASVAKKLEATNSEWRDVAVSFLRRGIAKLGTLIDQAGTDQIRDVAGAVKIVGELQVVREALGVDQPRAASQGDAAPKAPTEPQPRLRVVGD